MILKADILGSQETDTAMEVVLSTGSREYLNPEHMIKAFLAYAEGMILRHILIFTALICCLGNDQLYGPLELGKGG